MDAYSLLILFVKTSPELVEPEMAGNGPGQPSGEQFGLVSTPVLNGYVRTIVTVEMAAAIEALGETENAKWIMTDHEMIQEPFDTGDGQLLGTIMVR